MVQEATGLVPATEDDVSDVTDVPSAEPEVVNEVADDIDAVIDADAPDTDLTSEELGADLDVITNDLGLLSKLTAKIPKLPGKAALKSMPANAKAMAAMAVVSVVSIVGAVLAVSTMGGDALSTEPDAPPTAPDTLGPGIEGDPSLDLAARYPISSSIPFREDSEFLKRMAASKLGWESQPLLPSLFTDDSESTAEPEVPTLLSDEANPDETLPEDVKTKREAFKPGELPEQGRPWRDYLAVLKNALDLPRGVDCDLEVCWLLLNQTIDPQFDAHGYREHIRRLSEKLDPSLASSISTEQAIRRLTTFLNSEFTVARDSRPLSLPNDVLASTVKPARSSPAAINLMALVLLRRLAESASPPLAAQELHQLGYTRRIPGRTILTFDGRPLGRELFRNADFTQAGTNVSDRQLARNIRDSDILGGLYLQRLTNREFFATLVSELAPALEATKAKALLLEVSLDERRGDPAYRDGWVTLAKLKLRSDEITDLENLVAMKAQGIETEGLAEQVLALRSEQAGELEAARDAAILALRADDENPNAMLLLARIHFALDELEAASGYVKQATEFSARLHNRRKPALHELSLNIALAQDNTSDALVALERLSQADSERAAELAIEYKQLRQRHAIHMLADTETPIRERFVSLEWLLPKLKLEREHLRALLETSELLGNTGNTEIDWRIANRLKVLTGQDFKLDGERWQVWLQNRLSA
ncbi:MAG: hypothetical protein V3V10_03155 [Planctomycetota bacterium]